MVLRDDDLADISKGTPRPAQGTSPDMVQLDLLAMTRPTVLSVWLKPRP
jgi:hypothetical protein